MSVSSITLKYACSETNGDHTVKITCDGDLMLTEVLRKIQLFLQGVGYGVDELVAKVDVKGQTIAHSSEDFA